MGYHKRKISKGEVGELSKIFEEVEELQDAQEQNNPILILCEMADICGAMTAYLEKYHPMISIHQVVEMSDMTNSAFKEGSRK